MRIHVFWGSMRLCEFVSFKAKHQCSNLPIWFAPDCLFFEGQGGSGTVLGVGDHSVCIHELTSPSPSSEGQLLSLADAVELRHAHLTGNRQPGPRIVDERVKNPSKAGGRSVQKWLQLPSLQILPSGSKKGAMFRYTREKCAKTLPVVFSIPECVQLRNSSTTKVLPVSTGCGWWLCNMFSQPAFQVGYLPRC